MNRIHSLTLIGSLFLSACTSGIAQTPTNTSHEESVKTEVMAKFNELVTAIKSLKTRQYLDHFDKEQFTSLNDDGTVTHSLETFATSFRQQIPAIKQYIKLEFSNIKISVINPSAAILVNEYTTTVELQSGDIVSAAGAGTQVWSKNTGDWKLVNVSSSLKSQ